MPSPDLHPIDTDLHCPECDYNLTGATGPRCPWCGWTIDENSFLPRSHTNARRFGAVAACLVYAVGSLLGVLALIGNSPSLSILDGLAVVGITVAAIGHFFLAGLLLASGPRWPLRRTESTQLIRFGGWFSIVTGVAGATSMLQPRLVLGVPVTSALEFFLAAALFTLPGWALLIMGLVSFRDGGGTPSTRQLPERPPGTGQGPGVPFFVDWFGACAADEVTQEWVDTPRKTNATLEAAITKSWEAQMALARVDDRQLFDGRLIRLVGASPRVSGWHLVLGSTSYREFLGTHLSNWELSAQWGEDHRSNALGVSANVITRDGYIAYGVRSDRVIYHAGMLHPFGGMLDAADRKPDGTVDLFGALTRELEEEVGMAASDLLETVLIGLVRDRILRQPELLFDVTTKCSRSDLTERFKGVPTDGEHTGIEFLHDEPDAVIPSLNWARKITPVAEAAYLLHGRRHWGQEWYENTCYLRYGEVPRSWPAA